MLGLMSRSLTTSATSLSRPQNVGDTKASEDAFLVGVVGPHDDARQPKVQEVEVVSTVASKFSPMATTAASRSSTCCAMSAFLSVASKVTANATSSFSNSARPGSASKVKTSAPRWASDKAIWVPYRPAPNTA